MAERKPAAKKAAPRKTAPRKPVAKPSEELSTAQEDAIRAEVERRVEKEVKAVELNDPQNDNPQKYIRNLMNVPLRFKLERHTPGQRGIQLQARGNRGDLAPVQVEDQNDPIFQDNLALGLFEIVTASEASNVVDKQTTNQQAVHPAMLALRNEKGDAYDHDALKVDQVPFEKQGVVVAKLEDGQIAIDRRTGDIKREAQVDNINQPGVPAYISGAEPGLAPKNEEGSFLSDQKARQKGPQNANELGLNVSLNPVQRT